MRYTSLAFFVAASLASSLVQAETIEFHGEVMDQTCKAKIDGQTDAVVKLDTVSPDDFGDGNVAGAKAFVMVISDCKDPEQNKRLNVKFKHASPTASGNLSNLADDAKKAKGVSVQLLDDGKAIDLKGTSTFVQLPIQLKADGTGKHAFTAQYYKEETDITSGAVKASVEYTLTYL